MPVVDLECGRLEELAGSGGVLEMLPFLGLDIESEAGGAVRVEYSPNRPDYSTEYGIALGLQGLAGSRTGIYPLRVDSSGYSMRADESVSDVRPRVTGIAARGRLSDHLIRQIIAMQEDLHDGLGRRRRAASIGVHDLDSVAFPLLYTTLPRSHRFAPLGSDAEMTVDEILDMPIGRKYGHILGGSGRVPVILDARGRTLSLPPVINSALTTLTEDTRGLLIEVTGLGGAVEDALAVIAVTLQAAGLRLLGVEVGGAGNRTPRLGNREMSVDAGMIGRVLGTPMSDREVADSLARCRLDAEVRDGTVRCVIPPYRFDILGPMDIVEEVALGYGIGNLSPTLPPSPVIGGKDPALERLERISHTMVGLGYTEAMSSSLTSERILYGMTGRDPSGMIPVAASKSREHTILRDSILPGLIESLSRNVHETYPQRLFEVGTVFSRSAGSPPVLESTSLACVDASNSASFSGMRSVLQAVLRSECITTPASHPAFEEGRAAGISSGGKSLGHMGEVSRRIIRDLRIRVPVAAFECSVAWD